MPNRDEPVIDLVVDAETASISEPDVVLEPTQAVAAAAANERQAPSMFFLVGSLVGGNSISLVLKAIGELLQTKFADPTAMGAFGSIGLVLGYIPFLQIGVLNGINRELPYFIGKGDRKKVNELAAAAQAWALILGGTTSLALLAVALWQLACGELQLAAGWLSYSILAFLLFYNTSYLQMTYRTSHDFARLAIASVVENSVAFLAVGLVVVFSFYGLCLRAVLAAVVSVALLQYWRPVRVRPHWDTTHFKHLFWIGLPIFIVGQVYAWWTVLNSTLILGYMGQKAIGLYYVVLTASQAMEVLPQAVSQVLYPRMSERYGRTGELSELIHMSIMPTILLVLATLPAIAVAWWLVDPAIRWFLPQYVEAIPATRWIIVAALPMSFAPVANVYNVVRRQDLYFVAILGGMGTYVGSVLWLVRDGATLAAFAQAMVIGRVVFVVLCFAFLIPLVGRHNKSRSVALRQATH